MKKYTDFYHVYIPLVLGYCILTYYGGGEDRLIFVNYVEESCVVPF